MALFKKNIWTLYCLFVVASVIFMIVAAYMRWTDVYQNEAQQQTQRAEQTAASIRSVLASQEMLLDVLGLQLLPIFDPLDSPHSPRLFDDLMALNPAVSGFALARPDGQIVLLDSSADHALLPNLLTQKSSRDSFLQTLAADRMVLGRTYYQNALGSWGVPIRKALRDEHGQVIAVICAVLKLEGITRMLNSSLHTEHRTEVSLVRGQDYYLQYHSPATDKLEALYNSPVTQSHIVTSLKQRMSDEPRALNDTQAHHHADAYITDAPQPRIEAVKYEAEHDLWVFSSVALEEVVENYLARMLVYFVAFVVVHVVVFRLFRSVAHADERSREKLEYQAYHDPLTHLPNRQFLIDHTSKKIQENSNGFSLLFMDVDNFKGVNDNLGHDYGDRLLSELGKKLKATLSDQEVLVRLGGDEFVVVTPLCNEECLKNRSLELAAAISSDSLPQGLTLYIDVSIGIASYPQDGESLNALLRAADIAMLKAKSEKTHVEFYRHNTENTYLENYRLEQALRSAIGTDELYMFYQPQVNRRGQMIGVEALVRWHHPEMGFISPERFIPVAETSDLMTTLGAFVVERTLCEMSRLRQQSGKHFTVSINISVRQLTHSGFIDGLMSHVSQHQFQPQDIILEITENLFIEDMNNVGRIIIELQNRGFNISLDDFGTGYSSLSVLQKLPIDELKIDKSFVDDITRDKKARRMIKNIIAIGKNYGMSVLAEGVETVEQERMLSNFGCDCFQGYLFAKPMSAHDLQEYL